MADGLCEHRCFTRLGGQISGGRVLVDADPAAQGTVLRSGQRIGWQQFGTGDHAVLLMPTWTIVHSDFWRHQVPHLAEHYRVVAFDGLGNGSSDRPEDPSLYGDLLVAEDAVAVLDACGIERAAVMGVSQGGPWALALAGLHPERVEGVVFIAPNVPLAPGHPARVAAHARFGEVLAEHEGWAKWNQHHWMSDFPDFLQFFFSQCFTEPGSGAQIEHFLEMGLQTTPQVLLASGGTQAHQLTSGRAAELATRLRCPSLVIHGTDDAITPLARGTELARLSGADLEVLPGSGHEPQCRNPEVVNPLLDRFLQQVFPTTGGST